MHPEPCSSQRECAASSINTSNHSLGRARAGAERYSGFIDALRESAISMREVNASISRFA